MFEGISIDEITREIDDQVKLLQSKSPLRNLVDTPENKIYFKFNAEEYLFRPGHRIQQFKKGLLLPKFGEQNEKYHTQWHDTGTFTVVNFGPIPRPPQQGYTLSSDRKHKTEEVFAFNRVPPIKYEFFDNSGLYLQIPNQDPNNTIRETIYLLVKDKQ